LFFWICIHDRHDGEGSKTRGSEFAMCNKFKRKNLSRGIATSTVYIDIPKRSGRAPNGRSNSVSWHKSAASTPCKRVLQRHVTVSVWQLISQLGWSHRLLLFLCLLVLPNSTRLDRQILLNEPSTVSRPVRSEPFFEKGLLPARIEAQVSHQSVQVLSNETERPPSVFAYR
jgi:hypothetical protein